MIVALGALLGLLAGAATASPALADGRGDGWQFISLPPSFTLPADFCGFEIQVTQLVDKLYAKALKTADGSEAFLETGATRMSFTNPANGKTITQNGAGSFTATFFPDGSVTTVENGIGANALEPADAARFGLPAVFFATGKLAVTSAPDGTINLAVPERPRSGGRMRGAEVTEIPVPWPCPSFSQVSQAITTSARPDGGSAVELAKQYESAAYDAVAASCTTGCKTAARSRCCVPHERGRPAVRSRAWPGVRRASRTEAPAP